MTKLVSIITASRGNPKFELTIASVEWNGHRMYGAACYLCEGDYIMFLDDDNFLDPSHVEDCLRVCESHSWAYSLRKIVDEDGRFVCNDDCESLGKWPSVLGPKDFFVDVNCYS